MTPRIIFMGTPDFAVPTLRKLHQQFEVVMVVTQPDRPSGRGRKLELSPVKQVAMENNLPLLQPRTLRHAETLSQLRALAAEVIVVAAFGQILRPAVLTMPPHGCLNIHASLLPRWRGAAPVAAAIRAGDSQTGVTIMQMDEGLDTGPILAQRAIPIGPQHNRASLTAELADLGADLLLDTLPDWLAGQITPQAQDDALATMARQIKKDTGQIDWRQSALEIERHIRAFHPWPGTYTFWQNQRLKIISATVASAGSQPKQAGTVYMWQDEVAVATGQGSIILDQIQLAGKRALPAKIFVNGNPTFITAQLTIPDHIN